MLRDPGNGIRSGERRVETPAVHILPTECWAEAIEHVRGTRCDQAVIIGPFIGTAPSPDLIDARGRPVTVIAANDVIDRMLERIPLDIVEVDAVIAALEDGSSSGRRQRIAKRALDIGGALLGGLVLLPFLPVIALAIRLDSPGPVFYTQTRVGLRGKPFRMIKFRSMAQDAERGGAVWARERDPRVTRVGRFMRLTRIDELPQLWNVLRGEMALVGPRPERPEFTTQFEQALPAYAARHAVKPGLTGWAQVRYRYAQDMNEVRKTLEYDLYYVKHASLALDLSILFRTIQVVVRMQGC
jgi:exopolysaccharide biosynthesis polyprenyl glycosylphosphotransferase